VEDVEVAWKQVDVCPDSDVESVSLLGETTKTALQPSHRFAAGLWYWFG
jgi:hypothetical protein